MEKRTTKIHPDPYHLPLVGEGVEKWIEKGRESCYGDEEKWRDGKAERGR
ncbi:hypothetical protein C1H46_017976 [Malus baccata]|uniref:Uncharacterized protein n=1 Tax=Malus baccata TaxID=106549 RepID=A0A540MCL8_MALBA|nr:hypothetical protein C1H46_017976 [Malus baccata]